MFTSSSLGLRRSASDLSSPVLLSLSSSAEMSLQVDVSQFSTLQADETSDETSDDETSIVYGWLWSSVW